MALDRDVPKKKGAVKWKTLFEEDREGNQLAFVETLRDQHVSWGGGVAGWRVAVVLGLVHSQKSWLLPLKAWAPRGSLLCFAMCYPSKNRC